METKEFEYVLYQKEGNIARIIMNRPEKLNALSRELYRDVLLGLEESRIDDDVKVVIIKGAGRAFSSGHDLTQVGFVYGFGTGKPGERRPSERVRLNRDRDEVASRWLKMVYHPKVTIGQVHGYCLGGALLCVLMFDMAICSEDAQLGFTDQRLGFAGASVIEPIIYHVGPKITRELLLTGKIMSGTEAARIGLVNRAVPADKLEEEVEKLAEAVCLQPRDGIAIGKAMTHLALDTLGYTRSLIEFYLGHTLFTNLRWEPDEYNFFRERREKGAREAFHGRDERFIDKV